MTYTAAKALVEGWFLGLNNSEVRPRPPNLARCSQEIPPWVEQVLRQNNHELESSGLTEDGCPADGAAPEVVPNVNMPRIASWDGEAITVPRVAAASLTSATFYERYARAGMPVILTELFPNKTWWDAHVSRVRKRALADDRRQEEAAKGVDSPDCGRGWCRHGVHVAAEETEELASIDNANMPALLNRFEPHFDASTSRHDMPRPKVLFARAGAEFGGPFHYDQGCYGSFTIQYTGLKRWTLWAPWELPGEGRCGYRDPTSGTYPGVGAHTRYVAELQPTDTLYFPPAWFHHTKVLPGEISFSAAHFVYDAPVFGCLGQLSLWPSRFGFEACAAGPAGWRAIGAPTHTLHPFTPCTYSHATRRVTDANTSFTFTGAALDRVLELPPTPVYPGADRRDRPRSPSAHGAAIGRLWTPAQFKRRQSGGEPPRVEL